MTDRCSGQSVGGSSVGTGTGTPTSQGQSRRRPSSAFEDRLAAFQLGPATLQHLARSEQAHDEAMTRFLGEQVRTLVAWSRRRRMKGAVGWVGEWVDGRVFRALAWVEYFLGFLCV